MRKLFCFFCAMLLVIGLVEAAKSELHDRGGGLIYDDVLDVTWLQDANYAQTSGYDSDGKMTWEDAKAWADNLEYYDSVRNVTWTDWRLPHTLPVNGSTYNYTFNSDGSTDRGYNISASGSAYPGSIGSEMSYMYYNNLNNLGWYDIYGNRPQPGWSNIPNASFNSGGSSGPLVSFQNLQAYIYWSGTDYTPDPNYPWSYKFDLGDQVGGKYQHASTFYAWAVRDGDVSGCSSHAALQIIGTATYMGSDYNLIYEADSIDGGLVWLDYTPEVNDFHGHSRWAEALSFSSTDIQLTGYTTDIDWSTGWRAPLTQDQTDGYNQTGSEMGHLYYMSLAKPAGGPLGDTSPFAELLPYSYWSGTEEPFLDPGMHPRAWDFDFENGRQSTTPRHYGGTGLAVRPGKVFCVTVQDADADGIEDLIDTSPVYSDEFNDGMTNGTIIDRADQIVTVTDEPDPKGVRIAVASGFLPATVSFCGGSATLTLTDGDEVVVTCGSVEVEVITGPVDISFVADDGTTATTSLDAGNRLMFDPETLTITAPSTNIDDALILVDGEEFSIEPGESVKLYIVIDGCDTGVPNQLYEGDLISDLIDYCAANAKNHGKFVSCVAKLTNQLKKAGLITGKEKGAIQRCAAQSSIAHKGDCNGDGCINLLDFNILIKTFGESKGVSGYDERADFDKDESVNLLDFNIFKNNYGKCASD